MSIVKKEDKPIFSTFSQSTNFSTGIVMSTKRTAIKIEQPKQIPEKKKVRVMSYADVLEECIKMGIDFKKDYSSPCGGRCPNGIIGTKFLKFTYRFGHDTITASLVNIGINVSRDKCSICPQCFEYNRDHSWLAYHLAHDHHYSLEMIVETLRSQTKEEYKEISSDDTSIVDNVNKITDSKLKELESKMKMGYE